MDTGGGGLISLLAPCRVQGGRQAASRCGVWRRVLGALPVIVTQMLPPGAILPDWRPRGGGKGGCAAELRRRGTPEPRGLSQDVIT